MEALYPVGLLVIRVYIGVKLSGKLTEDSYIAESTNSTVKLHFSMELLIQAEEKGGPVLDSSNKDGCLRNYTWDPSNRRCH